MPEITSLASGRRVDGDEIAAPDQDLSDLAADLILVAPAFPQRGFWKELPYSCIGAGPLAVAGVDSPIVQLRSTPHEVRSASCLAKRTETCRSSRRTRSQAARTAAPWQRTNPAAPTTPRAFRRTSGQPRNTRLRESHTPQTPSPTPEPTRPTHAPMRPTLGGCGGTFQLPVSTAVAVWSTFARRRATRPESGRTIHARQPTVATVPPTAATPFHSRVTRATILRVADVLRQQGSRL